MLRRYQWWVLLLLNVNVIHMRSNWLCWKAQEKFHVESRFCKTTGCSWVTLLTMYLAKKQYSKLATETLGKDDYWRRHLTTSYLPEVTVQNHVWTVFPIIYTNLQSKFCFQFCCQVQRPVISTIVNPYMSFYENHYRNIWFMRIQNAHIFLFLEKQPQKATISVPQS